MYDVQFDQNNMKCLFVLLVVAAILVLNDCLPANRGGQISTDELCRLPPKKGICRAYIELYYYDVKSQACKEFVYGGCLGNSNSFDSIQDCMATCQHIK